MIRSAVLSLLAGVGVFACAPTQAVPAEHAWKTYTNVRYNYSTCYPEDALTPQPEAPDSDGRAFTAKDGAKLLVFGSNNVMATSVKAAADQTATRLAAGGTTSYRVIKPGWFVVSGSTPTSEFYAKSFHVGDQSKSFELTYPAAEAAKWRPIAARLNACFHTLG
ncbi:hypothetical protein [Polymorphobacter megasporae]|uniref:hypothetical protein n=1 Tax=Glacieibacterium megasporae TaxID=2835787 RepID=UPI001C1E1198|nr:hypothetical protein [Polymorphobacter megasporae]UAJ10182.1 hypothetical protein KTC28_18295 [Polymorphobacter megasporae]